MVERTGLSVRQRFRRGAIETFPYFYGADSIIIKTC